MTILNQLETSELPNIFKDFLSLIEPKIWKKVASNSRAEAKRQPFLKDYLLQKNFIAITLTQIYEAWESEKPLPFVGSSLELYETYIFVSQTVQLARIQSPEHIKKFLGRVRGSFKNFVDQEALRFEFLIAVHFSSKGYEVSFPEQVGLGNFDWLVTKNKVSIEVECKLVTENKGRKVKMTDALKTHELIRKETSNTFKTLKECNPPIFSSR